jgi:hypothetical protein
MFSFGVALVSLQFASALTKVFQNAGEKAEMIM